MVQIKDSPLKEIFASDRRRNQLTGGAKIWWLKDSPKLNKPQVDQLTDEGIASFEDVLSATSKQKLLLSKMGFSVAHLIEMASRVVKEAGGDDKVARRLFEHSTSDEVSVPSMQQLICSSSAH